MQGSKFSAEQRLGILQQAEAGLPVAQICHEHGISRTLFYRWKARFAQEGLTGLSARPPVHKTDALKTSPKMVMAIIRASRDHPYLGCRPLSELVSAASLSISFSQVQKIIRAHGLATRDQRWLATEDAFRKGYSKFSKKTLAFVVERNPSFRERHLRTYRPRENLTACTFTLPQGGFRGRTYVAVVDVYSSFAFVDAVAHPLDSYQVVDKALARFSALGCAGSYLFTDRSAAFNYKNVDLAKVLKRYSVRHVASEVTPRGFVESLREWLIDRLRESQSASQAMAILIDDYNTRHAPSGFPNYGFTPAAIFLDGVSTRIEHKPAKTVKRR